jgi:queuosine precursor transporter
VRVNNHRIGVGGHAAALRMSTDAFSDPYRVRIGSAGDSLTQNYGRRGGFWSALWAVIKTTIRLVLPVVTLLMAFSGIAMFLDSKLPYFPATDGGFWLTDSHFLVPVAFFLVHLTNRRYGPGMALAQVVLALGAVAALVLFASPDLRTLVRIDMLPPMRVAVAFAAAFFIAGFVSITAFDGARGASWWTAPFAGFLAAGIFFPLVFFPMAFAGSDVNWLREGAIYAGLLTASGIALLVPYFLFRPIVPPLPGFGGY